ncbi:RrF2 family transcriptional regulator [Brevibacillus daliensis]|uniref:RrF2 family transcriptional regulator n=1 Tax=Brevibacillus daliensis TaxID=2892995 RepID=UPI001E43E9B5|nr:Rrf2 family transcriptional regulator [Brevibacillus daliensis]
MRMKSGIEQAVYTMFILSHLPDRNTLSAESLSECLGVSTSYLKKLMRKLVEAGLIYSSPGIKGGFSLAKSPCTVTVYDVYLAVEGVESLYRQSGVFTHLFTKENQSLKEGHCAFEVIMDEAELAWKSVLQRHTLSTFFETARSTYPQHKLDTINTWIANQLAK